MAMFPDDGMLGEFNELVEQTSDPETSRTEALEAADAAVQDAIARGEILGSGCDAADQIYADAAIFHARGALR